VERAIGDKYPTIDDPDRAIDDPFQAIDDEDRAFDSQFQTIDDGFRLKGDRFPANECRVQTKGGMFALILGLYVSFACLECQNEAGDRGIEAKVPTIPDLYLCFAVVDGRRDDAFPARLVR
jgi:hypothetical protein